MPQSTRELIKFLAVSLASFMATNRQNNQKWTKSRVADYISGSTDISGSISDTTIGRFLDPNYPQEPSPSSIRMVSEFLLHHGWISQNQLDLIDRKKEVQIAAALSEFFNAGDLAPDRELREKLDGSFVSYILRVPYLLETTLYVTHHHDERLISCAETMRLFKVNGNQQIKVFTKNINQKNFGGMESTIKAVGAKLVIEHFCSGAGVANSGLVTFLMKADKETTFSSVISLDSINMNDAKEICGLSGSRNRGWITLDEDETLAPYDNISKASPHHALRYLCGRVEYYPQLISEVQHMRVAENSKGDDSDVRKFYGSLPEITKGKQHEKQNMDEDVNDPFWARVDEIVSKTETPDEKIKLAIEWGSLKHFKAALEEGADADMKIGRGYPLIFAFAATSGMHEWTKALVEIGKCDLSCTDEYGMLPNHRPAVLADTWEKAGRKELSDGFLKNSLYLQEQQIKQHIEKHGITQRYDDWFDPK